MKISSIVITNTPNGYTAYLRFKDKTHDEIISSTTYDGIHSKIDGKLKRVGAYLNG